MSDELTLPFIFVADGADPPLELAAFKAANLDCVSCPAIFIPHEQPEWRDEPLHEPPAADREWPSSPRKERTPPRPAGTHPATALRAFQCARAAHPDPVTAMRALRDAPERYVDQSDAHGSGQAVMLTGPSRPNAEASGDHTDAAVRDPLAPQAPRPADSAALSSGALGRSRTDDVARARLAWRYFP